MGKKIEAVDKYIANSEEFARPILKHLRKLIHEACPDVVEVMKWSFPNFEYKGPFCSMASFKKHCTFGFWKGALLSDPYKIMGNLGETAMGSFGRISSLKDLPEDKIMIEYIQEAKKLNDEGVKVPKKVVDKKELVVPEYFVAELSRNKKAAEAFNNFSYSHRKEYLEWITEAKTETTRIKRMETAIEWLSEGKSRNWKYERK